MSVPRTRSKYGKTANKKLIDTIELGKITPGYTSNISMVSEEELNEFVKTKINYGPQVVSIPVPPCRHAFLVDIQKNKIMISDWNGEETKKIGMEYMGNKKNKYYDKRWKQYSDLMIKLEHKYNLPIEYYEVDNELYKISNDHNTLYNGGGCSKYIYAWIEKHY